MKREQKLIKRRPIPMGDKICEHPLLDRIYRARHVNTSVELDRSFGKLLPPSLFTEIGKGVELLIEALEQQSNIIIVGDFDADGATSTALMMDALSQLGFKNLSYLIPNRFDQGYGLSLDVAEMAVASQAGLVITVDNGISSLEGVAFLKQHNVKVLITDHHLPGENLPIADCIINPNLQDSTFPSKALAGVGVAFYLMLAVRAKLRELKKFDQQSQPHFLDLLDLVALGTIADVVPLDQNNRILAFQGLGQIKKGHCRPGIQALIEVAHRNREKLTAADLGFAIAPRLNAAGRLDNMSAGVELLLCKEMEKARALAYDLDALNQARREIESGMKEEALKLCQNMPNFEQDLPYAIALYQADWHQGVLGILASRIKDKYHRPTIAFAEEKEGILRGSARSIEGIHIRDILERVNSLYPDMLVKFGGHAMAAGLSLKTEYLSEFQKAFNQVVKDWVKDDSMQGIVWTDGELPTDLLSIATAELINQAGPWGQAFPEPVFEGEFKILQQRLLKDAHLKLMVEPKNGGPLLDAIAFNVDRNLYPDLSLKEVRLVYKLSINEFRGQRNLQLLIEHIEPLH